MHPSTLFPARPGSNQLLDGLADAERVRWSAHFEPVQLSTGQVLFDAGSTPACVYFPTTAVVSLMSMTRDGGSAELAVVGHEGVVGIGLIMGGNAMPGQAVVQTGGLAIRVPAHALRGLLQRAESALPMLLRYAQALMTHVAQSALCNRYHSIDQQLCRRLLLGIDRGGSNQLALTHEAAAGLLGVRREGVTAAALKLQHAGVIRYQRGQIHVLDRVRLEQRACECYASARKEHERLLPRPHPHFQFHPQAQPEPRPLPQPVAIRVAPRPPWPAALALVG